MKKIRCMWRFNAPQHFLEIILFLVNLIYQPNIFFSFNQYKSEFILISSRNLLQIFYRLNEHHSSQSHIPSSQFLLYVSFKKFMYSPIISLLIE